MSERVRNLAVGGLIVVMGAVLAVLVFTAPTDQDRVASIGDRIKCPVCQGESIANSPSQMARDMMTLVSERVETGQSDQAIIDELLASYSGAVLLDPPVSGATLVLWIAPFAVLVIGLGVIVWWRRHPSSDPPDAKTADGGQPRRLVPLLLLGGAFAAVIVVAGFFLQDREGPATGIADITGQDLDDVSNETMEAVIAANADNPQVDGMRLALAERYYEIGDHRSAFPHYLAVAESADATDPQAVTALVRLGWMAWLSDAAADDAVGLFDQALAIDSDSSTAKYLKAQVLWCGSGDNDGAEVLFDEVLADPELDEDSRTVVRSDLEAVQSGQECP